ncbi:MAG: hypothetical protein K8E24_016050 [Methanobacterium paludis]|nr:hypothetical protein [Methanobacterium paludis]
MFGGCDVIDLAKEARESRLDPNTTHVFKVEKANGKIYSGTVEYLPDNGFFKWEAYVDHQNYRYGNMNFSSFSFEDLMHRIEGKAGHRFTGLEILTIKKVGW